MKNVLWLLSFWIPLITTGQRESYSAYDTTRQGIKFIEGLSWKEIQKRAKRENKFVFIDCYATWCGPCKSMEKNVFTQKNVGDFFNQHFLSVRLQMDKKKNDNKETRTWYPVVTEIEEKYGIPAYPSFLLFAPSGELVNRGLGYLNDKLLLQLGYETLKPNVEPPYQTYYSKLAMYQQGKRNYKIMAGLADTALQLGQKDIAYAIHDVYRPYLETHKDQWYQPINLFFMGSFIKGSKDSFFPIFYNDGDIVDSILNQKGFSQYIVDKIIQEEEIQPITKPNKGMRVSTSKPSLQPDPNWDSIQSIIAIKYGNEFSRRNILQAQIGWYFDQNKWNNVANLLTQFNKKYTLTFIRGKEATFFFVNASIWLAIFQRSVDKEQIDAGINIMADIIKNRNPPFANCFDTYANLLYKAGRREEAIKYEQQAIVLDPESNQKKMFLSRMKDGKPTWPHSISNDFWDKGVID